MRSDEGGLTLETSGFESLYGGQFILSTQLIKPNFPETFDDPVSTVNRIFLEAIFHGWYDHQDIPGGGGEVTPRKIGWGCAARFPKPLPYLWPKSAIFPTLFMTWPKIRNPIYDPSLTNYRKHNLWKAFVNFLFDNDERVASS